MYFTFILRCSDNSYYVGSTSDLQERLTRHSSGRATPYTSKRLPVELVYFEKYNIQEQALQPERQIKKWSRSKKSALITGNLKDLKELAKSGPAKIVSSKPSL